MSDFQGRDGRADRNGEAGAPWCDRSGDMSNEHVDHAAPGPKATPSFEPQHLDAYASRGHQLIRLHSPRALDAKGRSIGKAPYKGWRQAEPLDVEAARDRMAAGENIGVRLRDVDLVIDVDPRNFSHGDDPVARLQKDLGVDLEDYPTVVTGSGGKHIYMLKPAQELLRETLEEYPGLEFKTLGRQVVAAGSAHPTTLRSYRWDDDVLAVPLHAVKTAPAGLLDLTRRPSVVAVAGSGERSPEELAQMLDGLEPQAFRDQTRWLEIMMASHHATGGDGREEFIAWSIGDPQYAADAWIVGRRWDSLHADSAGRRVTERTLFKALIDAGRADLLPRDSAEDDFPDDLAPIEPGATQQRFSDEWVWVADAERFIRRADSKKFAKEQWKSLYAACWPDGEILNAVWKGRLPIRKFESLVYEPCQGEFLDGEGGGRYNIWRQSGVEPKAGDVQPFIEHMAYLFPDETERGHVLDYMALLVQRPAEKINFALLVRGRQGTGKSWLGLLMERIIGSPNVVRPNNSEVTSNWTAWTEGAQLAIIEELMALGRLEVSNRLKPIITDTTLRIEDKGCKLYSIPNRLNLLAFTNHDDALPIERHDRRWLVVFSSAVPNEPSYYERIFSFLDGDGPSAVKQWLIDRAVGLRPKGVAPLTRGKEQMRRSTMGEMEQYLLDLVTECASPFDFDLVGLNDLIAALPEDIRRRTKNYRTLAVRFLRDELQAIEQGRYTKGDRHSGNLWSLRDHDRWREAGAAARADAYMVRRFQEE